MDRLLFAHPLAGGLTEDAVRTNRGRVNLRDGGVDAEAEDPMPGDRSGLFSTPTACLDDDWQGEPLCVLWEHELDARVLEDDGWPAVADRGLDNPALVGGTDSHDLYGKLGLPMAA